MSDIDNHLTYIQGLEARIAKLELVVSGLVGRDCTPVQSDPDSVIRFVADRYHTKPKLLLGSRRFGEHVWPRWVAMYLLHEVAGVKQTEVARLFNKDDGSVQHALMMIREVMEQKSKRRMEVERIVADFKRSLLAADLVVDAA